MKKMAEKSGVLAEGKPVIFFPIRKKPAKSKINLTLAKLLEDFTDECHKIKGHSFWAAIPSALSSFPDENSVKDVKEWGSWESSCYNKYVKHEREKK